MKRLSTIIVAVIALIAMAMPASAQSLSKDDFLSIVKIMDDQCPMDMGDGMIMKSVKLIDKNVRFSIKTNESNELIDMMNTMGDSMAQIFKKEILGSEDMKPFIDYCRENRYNIEFRMYSQDNSACAKLGIRWQDM